MRLRISCLAAALLLIGCKTATYAPAPTSSNPASVTFIRERAEPTAWSLGLYIDDVEYASISNRSHAEFKINPGIHKFELKWPAMAGQVNLTGTLDFKPGESSSFLIASAYEYKGQTYQGLIYNRSISLRPISKLEADKILEGLSHQ